MKKLIVIAILVAGGWWFKTQVYDKGKISGFGGDTQGAGARARVESLLDAWKKGGTGTGNDAQRAVAQWAKGVNAIADDWELSRSSDAFDNWRREKDLYKSINSYEIVDSSSTEKATIVNVKIDEEAYRMSVMPGERIAWAK